MVSDRERYELELLDLDVAPALRKARILVELHDIFDHSASARLIQRFAPTHTVHVIEETEEAGDLGYLSHLTSAEVAAALQEGRPSPMQWAVMVPNYLAE